MPLPDDADAVLGAVRLGWYIAEARGRSRPDGPAADVTGMPHHVDYPLPLHVERSAAELRLEAASVTYELAKLLDVDDDAHGASFGSVLVGRAKLLGHVRAVWAARALREALVLLQQPAVGQDDEGQVLITRLSGPFSCCREASQNSKLW